MKIEGWLWRVGALDFRLLRLSVLCSFPSSTPVADLFTGNKRPRLKYESDFRKQKIYKKKKKNVFENKKVFEKNLKNTLKNNSVENSREKHFQINK